MSLQLNSVNGSVTLVPEDGAGNANVIVPRGGLGKVLQVITTPKTDTFISTNTTWTDVTGMAVSITPSSLSSRVGVNISLGAVGGTTILGTVAFRLMRDITPIGVGDALGGRIQSSFRVVTQADGNHSHGGISFDWVDSPSTTATTTYKLQFQCQASRQVTINRTALDANVVAAYGARAASSITVKEIAA